MHFDCIVGQVDRDVGGVQEVVGEELLDQVALVSQAQDEFIDTMAGIHLHDVPEDGPAADLDHRLGAHGAFLADPGAQAAGQNDQLHGVAFRNTEAAIIANCYIEAASISS